jgi:DNA-binding response OmpR family regulator
MYSRSELAPKQVPCVSDIRWSDQRRSITIGRRSISLTPLEYQLLFSLQHGTAVTYAQLAQGVYRCSMDKKVREMIDKHIDKIRGKLRGLGFFVYCIQVYGYILLPDESWDEY